MTGPLIPIDGAEQKKKERAQKIESFLLEWDKEYRPSFREVSFQTGISLKSVYNTVKWMSAEGIVCYDSGVARSLRLSRKGNK
jgi:hypothetical protein